MNNQKNSYYSSFICCFLVIFFALLILNLFRNLNGGFNDNISFSSFLEFLSNAPELNLNFSLNSLRIGGDWGWFDFFRNFLNYFTDILAFVVFLGTLLVKGVAYLIYFISYLFA